MRTLSLVGVALVLAGAAAAGEYEVTYQSFDPVYTTFEDSSPIVDSTQTLRGFIHCQPDSQRVLVQLLNGREYQLSLSNTTHAAVATYRADTLLAFVFSCQESSFQALTRFEIAGDHIFGTSTTPVYEQYQSALPGPFLNWRVYLDTLINGDPCVVVGMKRNSFLPLQGIGEDNHVRWMTNFYDLNLHRIETHMWATEVRFGRIKPDTLQGMAFYHNYTDSLLRYGAAKDIWTRSKAVDESVMELPSDHLVSTSVYYGQDEALFVGDYVQPWGVDEVVLSGNTEGLLVNHAKWTPSTSCYSFFDGSPVELWYVPRDPTNYLFASERSRLLVGIRGGNQVIMRSLVDGRLVDSTLIDTTFGPYFKIFETGGTPNQLNMLTRNNDSTLLVLSFGSPTEVNDDVTQSLPRSFTLHQNYPNPFNAGTVITFDNHIRQHVTLEIVNALGQRVITLRDEALPVGTYRVEWNGRAAGGKELASGIYLARLSTETDEHSIKMLLVK